MRDQQTSPSSQKSQVGRLGGWEVGRLGGWEVGRLGGWEVGRLGGFLLIKSYFSC
ncbi:inorganic polyphosphate/ATP-NAD kinase [Lyngbya sp. PCC 8106]|nr:inorganic polyphosphate/ATP-NAD kinase [Lyngbya sp. PCC 8106]